MTRAADLQTLFNAPTDLYENTDELRVAHPRVERRRLVLVHVVDFVVPRLHQRRPRLARSGHAPQLGPRVVEAYVRCYVQDMLDDLHRLMLVGADVNSIAHAQPARDVATAGHTL